MRNQMNRLMKLGSVTIATGLVLMGCSKSASFSLLSDSASFQQNASSINGKIDILFVIDNSGSMATSQQKLAANISRFFTNFDAKGFDYQIAVTSTDAWRVNFGGAASLAHYKDGVSTHSGTFMVTPQTPDRQNVFINNATLGTSGNGDERAFQSLEAALTSTQNADFDFPRADAFFSIIILSDADDLSNTTASTIDTSNQTLTHDAMYSNPNIVPVQHYVDFLDQKFGVVSGVRAGKYNVNSIGVPDQACIAATNGGENKLAIRQNQLADLTGGLKGSLCDDFGTTLSNISYKIIELRTRFYLDRELDPATLHVFVDGQEISRVTDTTPQPWNGFYYHAEDNSVSFHGTAVPGPGSSISVSFDPTAIK